MKLKRSNPKPHISRNREDITVVILKINKFKGDREEIFYRLFLYSYIFTKKNFTLHSLSSIKWELEFIGDDMMSEKYQKVAYIGLRNADKSYLVTLPLYVKLDDLNKKEINASREELIRKVTKIMLNRYEKQISEFMQSKQPPSK